MEISALVCKDIVLSRFVPKDEKSQSVPTEILGLYNGFTMTCGNFQVPKRRVQGLKQLIDTMIKKHFTVSARCLSYLTGSLVSVGLALDPLVRLWTWSIYNDICSVSSEPLFWKDNVDCTWSENVDEGVLSRFHDANDYMIDPSYFQYIDEPWGPHKQTKQLNRYCSRYGSLGCEAADEIYSYLVKGEQLAFSSPIPNSFSSEAHVFWQGGWYPYPSMALNGLVLSTCSDDWVMEGFCHHFNDYSAMRMDFSICCCALLHFYIWHPILPNHGSLY